MGIKQKMQSALQTAVIGGMTTLERVQSGAWFNPLERGYNADPYPQYKRLREKDPFHRSRLLKGWVLTRYDDIVTVLRDSQRFLTDERKHPDHDKYRVQAIKRGIIDADEADIGGSMLRMDPPDHTRLRSLVSRAFTPRAVESLRPRIEGFVDEQLDRVERAGCMELIRDLAYPLPVTIIAEMLGISSEDRDRFKHWSDEIVRGIGMNSDEDNRRSMKAGRELRAYLEPIIEERRREPREDLISGLAAAEEQGDKLSVDEMYATVNLLLVAGNETTTNLIGNGMLALMRFPDQAQRLRDDPALIENAVEELLRFDSPVQATTRFAIEDTEINGHPVKAFEEIGLLLGAANRDPEQFDEPDRLYVARPEVKHLSLSHGIHYCLGAPLARIESQAAIGALVRRFPDMRLAGDVEWGDNIILRGPKNVNVSL